MPHHTPLIATIVASLVTAFLLGALAQRFRISPVIGYLLAGVIVGPFTPGYVADRALANELAEIGVILLMFGVGLHFSLKDLMSVGKIAIPGALVQMAAATSLGVALAYAMGWPPAAGLVFGLALSVASTVVLLRALQERRAVQTERGRIAVGWLIVEDLAMVLALVLLPALAAAISNPAGQTGVFDAWVVPLSITLAKVGGFVAFMLIVGRTAIPWILHYVAHTGSRELFRLAVLAIALGVAFGAAMLFGVSFALGAFFAGMILAESELSQRAAEETLPLRDAFAVLFFVSVGMLFNPAVLIEHPLAVLATLGIILFGKSLAALAIMAVFRRNAETSLTVAASLAQIGEFSFILASLGLELNLLPELASDLILAGAIISIMLNPLMFTLARWGAQRMEARRAPPPASDIPVALADHAVLVGYGRVGQVVARDLLRGGTPVVVAEVDAEAAAKAQHDGLPVVEGNCANPAILALTNIGNARELLVAIPDALESGAIVEAARRANPGLRIVARAHSDEAVTHLIRHGADEAIMGEREIAHGMIEFAGAAKPEPSTLAEPLTPLRPGRLIFDSAEVALLDGFRAHGAGPTGTISKDTVVAHATQIGFERDRLELALTSLAEKDCVRTYGDGQVGLTELGFLRTSSAGN